METTVSSSAILVGTDLRILEKGFLKITNGFIEEIDQGDRSDEKNVIDCGRCVLVPSFVNAHTHLGDAAFKDMGLGKTLQELFEPPTGIKHKLLSTTSRTELSEGILSALREATRCGATTIGDFREGGVEGIKLLQEASAKLPVEVHAFGRPLYSFSPEELEENQASLPSSDLDEVGKLLEMTNGLGISAPNQYTDTAMTELAAIAKKQGKMRATHVSESLESDAISRRRSGRSEVERALDFFDLNFLVHLTYASQRDIRLVAERMLPVVCCPRANATLGLKLPPIPELIGAGVTVALGTDNVMQNSPDLFRETEFTYKAYASQRSGMSGLSPEKILEMSTINGATALGIERETGSIEKGKAADLLAIRLDTPSMQFTRNLHSAIIHRAGPQSVAFVMKRGRIVYKDSLAKRDLE